MVEVTAMTDRGFSRVDVLAGVVLAAALAVLGVKLFNPTPIVISVEGGSTEVEQIPGFYTRGDVLSIAAAAVVAGGSTIYLLQPYLDSETSDPQESSGDVDDAEDLVEIRRRELEEGDVSLKDGAEEVYESVLEAGGEVRQSKVVDYTDLSKSHVSRKLDVLESKDLVERRRDGMGNVVQLK